MQIFNNCTGSLQVFAEGAEGGYMVARHAAGHIVMLHYGFEQQVGQEAELVATIRCSHQPSQHFLRGLWELRVSAHLNTLTSN